MARIFIDGFESQKWLYTAGGLWENYAGVGHNVTTGYETGYCFYIPGNFGILYKNLPSAAWYYFGFHYKGTGASGRFIQFLNGSTVLGVVYYSVATGLFSVYKGDQATWLATGSIIVPAGNWCHLQIYFLPHATTGTFAVKVNGIPDINFSGSTAPSTSDIDKVALYCIGGSATNYWDNFVVDDAAYPGVSRIALLTPSGAGNSTQWDPSAGSNYACVDEVPYSDADYVYTNIADEVDTYAASDLPSEAAVVKCVQVTARARKEGSGPPNIAIACRTTGGDYYSADQSLQSSFASQSKLWETNPGTAAAWTTSEVNAMEIGIKSRP